MNEIKKKQTILFQGDSITAANRNIMNPADLGNGYGMMTTLRLNTLYPGAGFSYINRGVNGNTIKDLKRRWERDCIKLNPDVVSILIGINDTWQNVGYDAPVSAEDFEQDYRFLLDWTRRETHAKIILCEPFVLPYPEDRQTWREDLDPKIHIVNSLAEEYETAIVPLDRMFQNYSLEQQPEYWAEDGVHPTLEGHTVIAEKWMEVFQAHPKFSASL
jgi:acyl-CoA thioesterase-1